MKKDLLITILILGCVCSIVGNSYACPIPKIYIEPGDEDIVCSPCWVTFNGTGSKDADENGCCITMYEWTFPVGAPIAKQAGPSSSCPDTCGGSCLKGSACGQIKCKYNPGGPYQIKLKCWDDEGEDEDTSPTSPRSFTAVAIQQIESGTVTSTTATPGPSETRYVARGELALIEAEPNPSGSSFPANKPKWTWPGHTSYGPFVVFPSSTASSSSDGTIVTAQLCDDPSCTCHKAIKIVVVEVEITEVKGLYKSDGSYLAGYKSDDDSGRVYSNRTYNASDEPAYNSGKQWIDLKVEVKPDGVSLPAGARIVWQYIDVDDPSNSDKCPLGEAAGRILDPNDYDASGTFIGHVGKDNTGTGNPPGTQPSWEAIAPYTLGGADGNETTIVGGVSKVRFNSWDHGGDNFVIRAKIKPDSSEEPGGADETGEITVWKRIDVEYEIMESVTATLPLDDVGDYFAEWAFVELYIHEQTPHTADAVVEDPDSTWVMGMDSSLANTAINNYVQAPPTGKFNHASDGGWFFLVAAHLKIAPGSDGSILYDDDGTGVGLAITLQSGLTEKPQVVFTYNAAKTNYIWWLYTTGSSPWSSFSVWYQGYWIPTVTHLTTPAGTPFLKSELNPGDLNYGFPSTTNSIPMKVASPGAAKPVGTCHELSKEVFIWTAADPDGDHLSTMKHELTHAFFLSHRCGNWDVAYGAGGEPNSCFMNYSNQFILNDDPVRKPIRDPWTASKMGELPCAHHILAIRQRELENVLPSW